MKPGQDKLTVLSREEQKAVLEFSHQVWETPYRILLQRGSIMKPDKDKLTVLSHEEQKAVLEFSHQVWEKFGSRVKEIILFGSKARGESERDSDIDILIVLTELSLEIKKLISSIAAETNIKYQTLISTIRYDATTWYNPVIQSSPFAEIVRNEGIHL